VSRIIAYLRTPAGSRILSAVIALLVAISAALGATLIGGIGGGSKQGAVGVAIDGPDADSKRDDKLMLTPAALRVRRAAAAAPGRFDVGGDLRGSDTTRAGVLTGPLAAQEWPGCKTAFHNSFSSRGGRRPELIWFHFTAGPNIPGWADLDGLTAYSANPRNEVSWHFAIDREGHCVYNVPLRYKAWTEANANATGIGIEMVGRGSEADYGGRLGRARLAAIVARIRLLYPNIKLRLGGVADCQPTRSGIVTHWMGGPCSGGHSDIRPYSIVDVIGQVRALLAPRRQCRIVAYRPFPPRRPRLTARPGPVVDRLVGRGYQRLVIRCAG
jgi:hypothetical protein